MPDRSRRTTAPVAAALTAIVLLGGCIIHGEAPEARPLTPAEMAVRLLPGQMNVSIELQKSCRPVGTIERFQSEYDIRIATVANGGNVAQFIQDVSYTHTDNNFTTRFAASDVRFWACPQ